MEVLKQKITPFSVSPSQPPDFFFSFVEINVVLWKERCFFVVENNLTFGKYTHILRLKINFNFWRFKSYQD